MKTSTLLIRRVMVLGWAILVFSIVSLAAAPTKAQDKPPAQAAPGPTVWRWTDIELMGHYTVGRDEIIKHIPLNIGGEYATDRSLWKRWSADLKSRFDFHAVHISAVRFVGGKAYLVVDVVERGNEDHDSFRAEPTGEIELPADLFAAHRRLSEYHDTLFQKGTPPPEIADEGFLDYDEPEMSRRVEQLVQLAPQHRQLLLEAIATASDKNTRATAATLLNWAGDTEKSIMATLPYLKDPSIGVRNNLTRFMLHYLDRIESPETRRVIIDALVPQLSWPSHADRNKAIYALTALAKNDDRALVYIIKKTGKKLRYIADNSILYNVRDPAQELLKMGGEAAK